MPFLATSLLADKIKIEGLCEILLPLVTLVLISTYQVRDVDVVLENEFGTNNVLM